MNTRMPSDPQFNKNYQELMKCLRLAGLRPKTIDGILKGNQADR